MRIITKKVSLSNYKNQEKIQKTIINIFNKYSKDLPHELLEYERNYIYMHMKRFIFTISLISQLFNNNLQGIRVLDVGSHAGYMAILLKKMGAEVYALDIPRPELQYWLKRYREHNIKFGFCDLTKNEVPFTESFDLILLLEVIEHIPLHPLIVFHKLVNKLRKGGYIMISTPNALSLSARLTVLKGQKPDSLAQFDPQRGTGHFRLYSIDELIYLAKLMKLQVVKIDGVTFPPIRYRSRTHHLLYFFYRIITKIAKELSDTTFIVLRK